MEGQVKVEVDINKILAQLGIQKEFSVHEAVELPGTAVKVRQEPTS